MSSSPSDFSDVTRASVLNSWKEIANYLGRGVRTVQRYERECKLPVRRLPGKPRSSVLALREELDQWVRDTSRSDPGAAIPSNASVNGTKLQELLMQSAQLCHQNRALRDANRQAILSLMSSIRALSSALAEGLPVSGVKPLKTN